MIRFAASLLASVLACTLAGCGGEDDQQDAGGDSKAAVYEVKGVVRKVKSGDQTIVIDHEEIPGYMGAMAMPFKVKNLAEIEGLKAGDAIEFEYHVEELSSWIEKVKTVE
ncbi:MAG: Cu/Ag efflux protein CusF [Verrucomicrobiales bacterium]|jgi:Cu/Ag efflux protein CusF